MTLRIAIEDGLDDVWQAVRQRGWDPVRYVRGDDNSADAIVLTGMDDNLVGDQTTSTKASVISARGLTPDEVVRQLGQRAKLRH